MSTDIMACDGVSFFLGSLFDNRSLDFRLASHRRKFANKFRIYSWAKLLSFLVKRSVSGLPEGIHIVTDEELLQSPTSGARYPAYWNFREFDPELRGGLLFQVLPQTWWTFRPLVTSFHHHLETVERFYPMANAWFGKTEITFDGTTFERLKWRQEIPAGEPHQLRIVFWGFCINVICMETEHHIKCLGDHHPIGGGVGAPHPDCTVCNPIEI